VLAEPFESGETFQPLVIKIFNNLVHSVL